MEKISAPVGVQVVKECLVATIQLGLEQDCGDRRYGSTGRLPRGTGTQGVISSELVCRIKGERGENMPPYPIMHALFFPVNQASEKISSSKVKFNS